jgi:hypothetical protein
MATAPKSRRRRPVSDRKSFPVAGVGASAGGLEAPAELEILNKVFILLRADTGVDFTDYKHTIIWRRIPA